MRHRLQLAILLLPGLLLLGCSRAPGCAPSSGPGCTRVLFVGNSYTSVNDLPGTFAKLARSGGHNVETGMAAEGGWSLSDHAASSETMKRLTSTHWDEVVLQEQSEIPSLKPLRETEMFPAARQLVSAVRQSGAQPVF